MTRKILRMLVHIAFPHIFVFCGKPATDMSFWFVYIQYLSCFDGKSGIDLHQSFGHVLVDCGLRNPKLLCGLSYGRIVFNNIIGNIDCSFLDIIFQRKTPRNTFLHCMRGILNYTWNAPTKIYRPLLFFLIVYIIIFFERNGFLTIWQVCPWRVSRFFFYVLNVIQIK